MQRYTASYFPTNNNFVIQNLPSGQPQEELVPAYCIVKNILLRGNPTLMSGYLKEALGIDQREEEMNIFHPLISQDVVSWERVIRGDDQNLDYPAKVFLQELWETYLPEYNYCRALILPEVPINTITQLETNAFVGQQVDFYLPQAFLVIEIDGIQHQHNRISDELRDNHLAKFGVKTVRISTREIRSGDGLEEKFRQIKNHIQEAESYFRREQKTNPISPRLEDYQRVFNDGGNPDVNLANAAMRFQVLLLELLLEGAIQADESYRFAILDRDITGYQEAAVSDVFCWLKHIFQLQDLPFNPPEIDFEFFSSLEDLQHAEADFWIDFSLHQRYTDLFQNYGEIIFLRTDYLDNYKYYKNTNGQNPEYVGLMPYDYFQLATSRLVSYRIRSYEGSPDEESLRYIISNIFLPDLEEMEFNPGQLPIIMSVLAKEHTIGLLPTGGGKSLCYQVAALLQPGISFVVCPIKSLMFDQKMELDSVYISRTAHITGNDDGEDRERLQKAYANGKYFFVFISPERFQTRSFRKYLSELNARYQFAYAVIDEVHCLSEWGHDFRISYLNLAQTIRNFCGNFSFIALTATASINVLKDIQVELGVESYGVRTLTDYTRPELEFEVIDDNNEKEQKLISALKKISSAHQLFDHQEAPKSVLIFTNTVNGSKGCFPLSNKLSVELDETVPYYSGSVPKVDKIPIMPDQKYEEYKEKTQRGFKQNKFPVLVATKAFGMGVNKKNIYYTFHYGIPGSMESLYQEAGRAGRDKVAFLERKANCYVLFGKTRNENLLEQVFARGAQLSFIKNNLGGLDGDINTNLFLFSVGNERIADEYKHIKAVLNHINHRTGPLTVRASDLNLKKNHLEKAIYRLHLLGVVADWIVDDFFRGHFEIVAKSYSAQSVKENLQKVVRKYETDFALDQLQQEEPSKIYYDILHAPERANVPDLDKYIVILLQWIYDHFAYSRRQSLKTIYENCNKVIKGETDKEEFKRTLEAFFKFSTETHILLHIAENPKEFDKWFELLADKEGNWKEKNILMSLQASLSRFLESFEYNTGLDYLSGMLRLFSNDFSNSDGEPRLASSLRAIKNWESPSREGVIKRTLALGIMLSLRQKNQLSKCLIDNYSAENEFINHLQESLTDEYSLTMLIESGLEKLISINQHIYERLESI